MFESEEKRERKLARKRASAKDRSKYKKTDQEKQEKKLIKKERSLKEKDLLTGRVLAIFPEEISVESDSLIYSCHISGVLKKETSKIKNLIVVGDIVLFKKEGGIVHVEKRKSLLARPDAFHKDKIQVIASNIDLVLITICMRAPAVNLAQLDRFIIATLKGNMQPCIVINKIDLVDPHSAEEQALQNVMSIYNKIGIKIIAVSTVSGQGERELKEFMKNKASVFAGESGVGKSSLINKITGLDLATGEVGKKSQKGVHTTVGAKLIPLEMGGFCIDTPGIQSLAGNVIALQELGYYFPEIEALRQGCKFPNCTHSHEPQCAVKRALENNEIASSRYASYLECFSNK